MPRMSVVMPTFNRRDRLETVLAPLLADPATDEVVVVVDGCEDGSLELLQELAAREPRLRPVFQANAGEGAARHAGVEAATGEVVLLIDDDVEAAPGLVGGHARHHVDGAPRVVVGYMPTLDPDPDDPDGFSTRLYAEAYEGRCARYATEPQTVLRHLWAGNVSLPREACLRVGLASDAFTERYHPDRELGLRLLEDGLTGVFDRSLAATHHHARPLDAFVRDARSQGAGWSLVHRLHPESAGELPEDRFRAGLPRPLAALVDACRRPRLGALVAAVLHRAVALSGRRGAGLGSRRVQLPLARLLRRVEQQRGAIAAYRQHRGAPPRG
jgi:glycosyltransferase involved in cell wall biosynthesis